MAAYEPPPFVARTASRNGIARVAVQGELDHATVPLLKAQLARLGDGDGNGRHAPPVLLDLRGLTFMDSSGLQAVLEMMAGASSRGRRAAAIGVNGRVRKIFELTRTSDVLNEADALELIQRFMRSDAEEAAE